LKLITLWKAEKRKVTRERHQKRKRPPEDLLRKRATEKGKISQKRAEEDQIKPLSQKEKEPITNALHKENQPPR